MAGSAADVIQAAKSKVQIPAILLILTGVVTLCMVGYGLAQGGGGDFDTQWAAEIKKIEDDKTKSDEEKKMALDMMNKIKDVLKPLSQFTIVFQIGAVAVGVLCIFGGVRVLSLKNRGLGILASILSMIPCISCCCLGIPVGIWLLIVLSNPVVKSGFAAASGGSLGGPVDDYDAGFQR